MSHPVNTSGKRVHSRSAKPVSLIQINRSELSTGQVSVLNFLTWKHINGKFEINPNFKSTHRSLFESEDQKEGRHLTTLKEVAKFIDYKSRNYTYLRKEIKQLAKTGAEFSIFERNENKKKLQEKAEGALTFLDYVKIERDGVVSYSLGREYMRQIEKMLEGEARYVYLNYFELARLKNKYGIALFEYLFSYTNNANVPKTKIDKILFAYFGAAKSATYKTSRFVKRVIDPAIEDIRRVSGIEVSYSITKEPDGEYIKFEIPEKDVLDSVVRHVAQSRNADNVYAYAKSLKQKYLAGQTSEEEYQQWLQSYNDAREEQKKHRRKEKVRNYFYKKLKQFSEGEQIFLKTKNGYFPLSEVRSNERNAPVLEQLYETAYKSPASVFGQYVLRKTQLRDLCEAQNTEILQNAKQELETN